MTQSHFDIIVIGGGPAGQKAAIQGAKARKKVLLVELDTAIGGACVQRGTIPSKTLRETAIALSGFQRRSGNVYTISAREDLHLASLITRKDAVVAAHAKYMTDQLTRNHVERWHGRASFAGPHEIEVETVTGGKERAAGEFIIIASGSRPREPAEIPIDHEHVLDSDSILSMIYLPRSLTVLGSGVIAAEYASIFGALGVKVTMIDKAARPLGFIDPDITHHFVASFEAMGNTFIGNAAIKNVEFDGVSEVVTTLGDGRTVRSEKLLCALGRVANVEALNLEKAGVTLSARSLVEVNDKYQTKAPHIYGVGDVIGPPSLASAAMEQGRRAVCHALGLGSIGAPELIPAGIYTIPEMSSVGLTEAQAAERHGTTIVGLAKFNEVARGQIAAIEDGLLKLIADPTGKQLLGVQVIGEGACELVHIGQMALLANLPIDTFVESVFNFPTLAEAYRVAALAIIGKRSANSQPAS